jgi:carbonic anhydrase
MSVTDELVAANETYAATFDRGDLALPPARQVAVLACMDALFDPTRAFGLAEGDAHVIGNAGGVASDDAIRSLAISQHLLDVRHTVRRITANPFIPHTDAGRGFVYDARTGQLNEITAD